MDKGCIFHAVLEVAEDFLNDEYSKAVQSNYVKEMESLNISILTVEMIRETFIQVISLMGDQDDD